LLMLSLTEEIAGFKLKFMAADFKLVVIERNVNAKVLSTRKQREKEDRIEAVPRMNLTRSG
jgi:hypothetical protein